MRNILLVLFLAGLTGFAYAADVPSVEQVYQTAHAGHLDRALQMMDAVLKAHPNSGKAHYIEAQLLSAAGRHSAAAAELQRAEALAPGLPFAKPGAVQELRDRIQHPPAYGLSRANTSRPGIPWTTVLLGLGAGVLLLAIAARLFGGRAPQPAATYGNAAPGTYGPGAVMQSRGGLGSSLGSGLATGLGIGAGVAAGEALAGSLFNHNTGAAPLAQPGIDPMAAPTATDPPSDLGGADFGLDQGDTGSWDSGGDVGGDWGGGGDDWN